jgi:hypothetical protein
MKNTIFKLPLILIIPLHNLLPLALLPILNPVSFIGILSFKVSKGPFPISLKVLAHTLIVVTVNPDKPPEPKRDIILPVALVKSPVTEKELTPTMTFVVLHMSEVDTSVFVLKRALLWDVVEVGPFSHQVEAFRIVLENS